LISKGKLDGAYQKIGRRYFIDPVKADAILETFENPEVNDSLLVSNKTEQHLQQAYGKLISYAEASRREKIAKAALLELRLKQEQGELIEREQVKASAAKISVQVRTGFEAIPSKIAPTLVGMSSSKDIAQYLQMEIRMVLTSLAKEIAENDL
jgi:hypothetical protein